MHLFLSMFAQHPHLLALFPKFRDKGITTVMNDPAFRAHGCAIGYHLTSMVASLEDAAALKVLAQRVGAEHLKRDGVKPAHFEVMGGCIIDVVGASDKRHMTVEAIQAWRKFITYLVAVIQDVYDKDAALGAEATSREWSRTHEATWDSDSITPSSVISSHAGSSKKQPFSIRKSVSERIEGPAVPQAADHLTGPFPIQDAAAPAPCKASPEKAAHKEEGGERSARKRSPRRQDVNKSAVRGNTAPEIGRKDKFREMVESKEQATS